MRILMANYRYFVSGGPERYLFTVSDALRGAGHSVIPFSVSYPQNEPTSYARYFVQPLDSSGAVYFRDHGHDLRTFARTLSRLFYSKEVEIAVRRLAAETRPDVAYVLHFLRKLSPSLLVGLKRAGVPIVVRLSDYQMFCPQAHFVRRGEVCTRCLGGSVFPAAAYGCVRSSRIVSLLDGLATTYHRWRRFFDLIDLFIVTNPFAQQVAQQAGISAERLVCLPTPVDLRDVAPKSADERRDVLVYVGRLDPIKGVETLIAAFSRLRTRREFRGYRLIFCGEGEPDYEAHLHDLCRTTGSTESVEFRGKVSRSEVFQILGEVRASIVPSAWFENFPNAVLESFAAGTPVVATRLGSLEAMVEEGVTGTLFRREDAEDLERVLCELLSNPERLASMGEQARAAAVEKYSVNEHVNRLLDQFEVLRAAGGTRAKPTA